MQRSRELAATAAADRLPLPERLLWLIVVATTVAVPLTVSSGKDGFRLPKELLLEAGGILLIAGLAITLLLTKVTFLADLRANRPVALLIAAILVWSTIVTALSTQVAISVWSLLWVVSCSGVFIATMLLAKRRPVSAAYVGLAPAVINAAVCVAQKLGLWSPIQFDTAVPDSLRVTALVGNPNEVGTYLLMPLIAAAALAITFGGRLRTILVFVTVLLLGGILAAGTLTALLAFAAAGLVGLARTPLRTRIRVAAAATIATLLIIALQIGPGKRVADVWQSLRAGDSYAATSLRTQGFLTAWNMIKDHPLVGVGPDCFGWWYVPYRIALVGDHKEFIPASANFREVHNDHLQVMVVSGVPGYAIFVAAIVLFARVRPLQDEDDPRARFVRIFARPAATGFAVLSLAQFPLESGAAMSGLLFFAGIAAAWGRA